VGESRRVELRGVGVQIAGTEPRPDATAPPPDDTAELRILLSHYPRLRDEGYPLVLAGHMHAGQIVLPYAAGKIRFAHLRAPFTQGLYRRGRVTLHVSPGLGTTFVPLRFFARPEVTELVLRQEPNVD
jgi:predicted MPP superfamily phosphohydrolase